jgi:hypothetical protein
VTPLFRESLSLISPMSIERFSSDHCKDGDILSRDDFSSSTASSSK